MDTRRRLRFTLRIREWLAPRCSGGHTLCFFAPLATFATLRSKERGASDGPLGGLECLHDRLSRLARQRPFLNARALRRRGSQREKGRSIRVVRGSERRGS